MSPIIDGEDGLFKSRIRGMKNYLQKKSFLLPGNDLLTFEHVKAKGEGDSGEIRVSKGSRHSESGVFFTVSHIHLYAVVDNNFVFNNTTVS